jgi:hypothetical protein
MRVPRGLFFEKLVRELCSSRIRGDRRETAWQGGFPDLSFLMRVRFLRHKNLCIVRQTQVCLANSFPSLAEKISARSTCFSLAGGNQAKRSTSPVISGRRTIGFPLHQQFIPFRVSQELKSFN